LIICPVIFKEFYIFETIYKPKLINNQLKVPLINSIFSWVMKKRIHQIELFMKYPHEVQAEWLKKLISTAKDTEWGKTHNYSSISTLKKFKERVPVQDYESVKPYIIQLRQGEQNLLWPSEIKWFSKSSGTTNDKSKFIPVSQEALEESHFKGGGRMYLPYTAITIPTQSCFPGRA